MASSRLERIGTIYSRVEGLLSRGAMRAEDRPVWFDVYRMFPPAAEPKFARPSQVHIPIRSIFYAEDQQRAEFHARGHGLGAVNMMNQSGESHTKKLLRHYNKLKSENPDTTEEKLIEESIKSLNIERGSSEASNTQDADTMSFSNLFSQSHNKDH